MGNSDDAQTCAKTIYPQDVHLMSIQSVSPLAQPNLNIDFAPATSVGQAVGRSTTNGHQRDGGRLVQQDGPRTCHWTNLSQLILIVKLHHSPIRSHRHQPRLTKDYFTVITHHPQYTLLNHITWFLPTSSTRRAVARRVASTFASWLGESAG